MACKAARDSLDTNHGDHRMAREKAKKAALALADAKPPAVLKPKPPGVPKPPVVPLMPMLSEAKHAAVLKPRVSLDP
jgi:hypothetical protein